MEIVKGRFRKIITKEMFFRNIPLLMVILLTVSSFIYGWYFDNSVPRSGAGWADQSLYLSVTNRLHNGQLPKPGQLHFTIGYSALGVVGSFITPGDPFVLVSFALIISSVLFCFFAAKKLFGDLWAMAFVMILFLWDGTAKTFNFASELFVIPWNNQVLFFLMAFYLWLFVTRIYKNPSWKVLIVASLISGYCFLVREETIIFVIPAMVLYLFATKTNWKKWLVVFGIIFACFTPQLLVKYLVSHSIFSSGRQESYSQISSEYLQPSLLKRNIKEVVIGGDYYQDPKNNGLLLKSNRQSLLQAAPWLWIAPIGIFVIFISKRYPLGLKYFSIISMFIILFYLSGVNMSGQKLQYHTLRYISSGFIILNLALIIVIKESIIASRDVIAKLAKKKKD